MTITARVHHHSITLPAEVEVHGGTEAQVILPAPSVADQSDNPLAWMEEFIGAIDTLPPDAAERHNELAHGRKRRLE